MNTDQPHVGPPRSVCALLTCFNRRDKTLACLQALEVNRVEGVTLSAVLVDDGSTDGTAHAVREAHPWVQVVQGDGAMFWCRGMHRAFTEAQRQRPDFVLWLNDDTVLEPDALQRLLACHDALASLNLDASPAMIVVGSTADPSNGRITYGGERRCRWPRSMRFERIPPSDQPQRCDSMTGNIVLVDAAAAQRVGNLDPAFEHAMGDTDYALRARRAGVPVWLAPGVLGHCADNPPRGTYKDDSLPFAKRWRLMMSRKGLPWRSWLRITARHGGWWWPVLFAWPYAALCLRAMYAQLRYKVPA